MTPIMLGLNALEASALLQVKLRGRVDEDKRRIVDRLIHLRLVDETPQGLCVTREGAVRCGEAVARHGWAA